MVYKSLSGLAPDYLSALIDVCRPTRSLRSSDKLLLNVPKINTYTLYDGLAYNTCGYFASSEVFLRDTQGRRKIRAMGKMSARIIC